MFITDPQRCLFMRHNNASHILQRFQIFQKAMFCFLVQRGGGLVQKQHRGFGQQTAGNGQPLHLPLGQAHAPLADHGHQALGQFVDKGVCTGDLNGPLHLLVRSITVNELQIIQYRAGQKHIPLGHIGKQPAGVLVCRDMAAVRHL